MRAPVGNGAYAPDLGGPSKGLRQGNTPQHAQEAFASGNNGRG